MIILFYPGKRGNINPHRQYISRVRMDVHRQGKFNLIGFMVVHPSCIHSLNNWFNVCILDIDRESRELKSKIIFSSVCVSIFMPVGGIQFWYP